MNSNVLNQLAQVFAKITALFAPKKLAFIKTDPLKRRDRNFATMVAEGIKVQTDLLLKYAATLILIIFCEDKILRQVKNMYKSM